MRLAVERELTPGRRQELHAEALRRLGALGAVEPAVAAFHARRAGDLALAYTSERAAAERAAALGAHREAAQHYRRALADAETREAPAELSRLLLALSVEEHLIGRDEPAARGGPPRRRTAASRHRPAANGAWPLRWLSRVILDEAGAGEVALEAVRVLEPAGPTPQLAAAYAQHGHQPDDRRETWPRPSRGPDGPRSRRPQVGDAHSEVVALQAIGGALTVAGQDPRVHPPAARGGPGPARQVWTTQVGRAYANLVSAAARRGSTASRRGRRPRRSPTSASATSTATASTRAPGTPGAASSRGTGTRRGPRSTGCSRTASRGP